MSQETVRILVADHVPLDNKGEEAIVRGIADMIGGGHDVRLGVLDNVPAPCDRGGIEVFPRRWLLRYQGNPAYPPRVRALMQTVTAIGLVLGSTGRCRTLELWKPGSEQQPLRAFFRAADYVVVGHDGVFCAESAATVCVARRMGKRTGVLGASGGITVSALARFTPKAMAYRRCFADSHFCVFRERSTWHAMRRIVPWPERLVLAPDPAFAMRPALRDEAQAMLRAHSAWVQARKRNRPIVAVTALEKGTVYSSFRPDLAGGAKQTAHARYLAEVLTPLVQRHCAFLLFLPHSIERDGDDRVAARHVVEQLACDADDLLVLQGDHGARLLKAVIAECDFLVGERTHSVVGAISVATPFVCLTHRGDVRTHGIVGDVARCGHLIADMDALEAREASSFVQQAFENRTAVRAYLNGVARDLSTALDRVGEAIRNGRKPVCESEIQR